MSSMLGTLQLKNLVSAATPSTEGLQAVTPAVSKTLAMTIKQEIVHHLIMLQAEILTVTTQDTDAQIVDKCLTIASSMLDRGDCTNGTFLRLQQELPIRLHVLRDSSEQAQQKKSRMQAMDIAEKVLAARTVGYNEAETKAVQLFNESRQQCEQLAQQFISLVFGHVKQFVPDLVAKYPDVVPQGGLSPFVRK